MDIGKPEKVTEEPMPRPVRRWVFPERGPSETPRREPERVPVRERERELVPARRNAIAYLTSGYPFVLGDFYVPNVCPRCGRQLEDDEDTSYVLVCPKHGTVWVEPTVKSLVLFKK